MTKTSILRAIPIVLLLAACIVLGGIIIAKNNEDYIPTIADGIDGEDETTVPEETEPQETVPAETEPPETEPPETEPVVVASQGLEFTSLGNGTCYVSGAGSCRDSLIILPEVSPYGERVIGVGDYAFRNCKFVKCVELNEDLKFVGAYAFYGTEMVNAYIPAELEQIGDFAFCNCPELENITVDSQNTVYSDINGILYNKEGSELICYPQGKTETTLYLSPLVEEIKTMAFYNCSSVKLVNYDGSVSSYRRIKVGAGNESFDGAVVSYVSGNNVTYNAEK